LAITFLTAKDPVAARLPTPGLASGPRRKTCEGTQSFAMLVLAADLAVDKAIHPGPGGDLIR